MANSEMWRHSMVRLGYRESMSISVIGCFCDVVHLTLRRHLQGLRWKKISVTQRSRVIVCPLQFTLSRIEGQDVCKHTKIGFLRVHSLLCWLSDSDTQCYISLMNKVSIQFITQLFFLPVCLQLMLPLCVKPLLEYHWVITLILVISVTYNFKRLWLFWQGTWKDLFHYVVMCETDGFFLPSCSDSRQSREHREMCRGWSAPLYRSVNMSREMKILHYQMLENNRWKQ